MSSPTTTTTTTTTPGAAGGRAAVLPVVLFAVAVPDFLALLPGWWWATAAVAFLAGLVLRGAGRFWTAVAGAPLGWTGLLLWQGAGHLGGVAALVGALATGQAGEGWPAFVITYATALLLALAGGWFGGASRRAVSAFRAGPADAAGPADTAAGAVARPDDPRVPSPSASGFEEDCGD